MESRSRLSVVLWIALAWCFPTGAFVCSCGAPAEELSLTVHVIAPSSTLKDAYLCIVGADSQWGNWDPASGARLTKESDSVWSLTRRVPRGYTIEFKVTRGSWDTEALYEAGQRPSNFSIVVKRDTTMTLRPVDWADNIHTEAARSEIVGNVRYHHAIKSLALRYARDVVVWLPPSYSTTTTTRYPVLYVHDGQNVFDASTSAFGHEWRADEVADSLIRRHAIVEIIIVGIYNTRDRSKEYSDAEQGRNYADFVAHELKPFIDSTYRTQPDRRHTAVMGASSGGTISFLSVWWYPDVFSKAACLSSAFTPDVTNILEQVRTYTGPRKDIRVYLDMGSRGVDSSLKASTDAMFSLLKAQGYAEGVDLVMHYDKEADHNEQAWAARLHRPLIFLFGNHH